MDKREALAAIRRAKSAHIKWRSFAHALLSGVEVTDEKLPKLHTECDFGKWYYSGGSRDLGHLDSFRAIESPHEMLHAIYGRIYETLHPSGGVPLLSRLFSSKGERERRNLEMAKEHMEDLVAVSETLLKAIEILEDEIRSTDSIPD